MNSAALKQFGPLMGRVLLALIFVIAGFGKLTGFEGTAAYMAQHGLPFVHLLLVLTIIIEIGGGLMIMLGLYARWAALVVFLFVIPVTLVFHAFWAVDPAQKQLMMIMFLKNLCIEGGLIYIMTYGSGPLSLTKDTD